MSTQQHNQFIREALSGQGFPPPTPEIDHGIGLLAQRYAERDRAIADRLRQVAQRRGLSAHEVNAELARSGLFLDPEPQEEPVAEARTADSSDGRLSDLERALSEVGETVRKLVQLAERHLGPINR